MSKLLMNETLPCISCCDYSADGFSPRHLWQLNDALFPQILKEMEKLGLLKYSINIISTIINSLGSYVMTHSTSLTQPEKYVV